MSTAMWCAVVALSVAVVAADKCQGACEPYFAGACKRGSVMDLRFMVDTPPAPGANANTTAAQIVYGFCAKVDDLSAFTLKTAAVMAGRDNATGTFNAKYNVSHLKVFGMGSSSSVLTPTVGADSDVVLLQNTSACGGRPALASFLMLNITMTNGLYKHAAGFNQAIQVGFDPTCKDGKCTMGTGVCVGDDTSKQMCSKCVSDVKELEDMPVHIWTSYYGTDSAGRAMKSGTLNPLRFRQFANSGLEDDVQNSVNSG
jgi:hypothetical protein